MSHLNNIYSSQQTLPRLFVEISEMTIYLYHINLLYKYISQLWYFHLTILEMILGTYIHTVEKVHNCAVKNYRKYQSHNIRSYVYVYSNIPLGYLNPSSLLLLSSNCHNIETVPSTLSRLNPIVPNEVSPQNIWQ